MNYDYYLEVRTRYNWRSRIKNTCCCKVLGYSGPEWKPCLWAIVNTEYALRRTTIYTYGTGHDISGSSGKYTGSYQLNGGPLCLTEEKSMASKIYSLDTCTKCGIHKNQYIPHKALWERVNCGCKKPGASEDKQLKKSPQ